MGVRLVSLVSVWVFILLAPGSALICWTNNCLTPGWCIQSCTDMEISCLALFRENIDGERLPSFFGCYTTITSSPGECNPVEREVNDFGCRCSGDLCNSIPELTPDGDDPTPVLNPSNPPPVDENDSVLVCEEYNCSNVGEDGDCYYGYQECAHPENGSAYCWAAYALHPDTGLYQLEEKKCITTDFACSQGDTCHLLTGGDQTLVYCCCSRELCNVNVTFSDLDRVNILVVDQCEDLGCHHSCIVHNGQPHCYCDPNYVLHSDNKTCVDLNECDFQNGGCSYKCVNHEGGGYSCRCPNNERLKEDGHTCEETGLICYQYECNDNSTCSEEPKLQYCDVEPSLPQFCQATYLLRDDGTFEPKLLSCFASDLEYCTPGECIATLSEANIVAKFYHCCCYENYCNSILNTSFVHPTSSSSPPMTTTSTAVSTSQPPMTDNPETSESEGESPQLSRSVLTFITVVVIFVALLVGRQSPSSALTSSPSSACTTRTRPIYWPDNLPV